MPQLVILDESRAHRFPLYGVGGIVVALHDVPTIERTWTESKMTLDLESFPVKYSANWPDQALRRELIMCIAGFPLKCVIALLEDFRPIRLKALRREARSDLYVQSRAFEYILQRLELPFITPDDGPHLVVFDHRDDLGKLADAYARHHAGDGWTFRSRRVHSPRELGYSASLFASANGPLIEIADFVVSAVTRWAGARCAATSGKSVPDLPELERDCATLRTLFPSRSGIPERWRGYSVITFTRKLTGRELLGDHIDSWLRELPAPGEPDDALADEHAPIDTQFDADDRPF